MADKEVLTQYEIVNLGVHSPDTFQGFGTAFTNYKHSVYGIGDNFSGALEDALEMIATMHNLGPLEDEELIALIKKEHDSGYSVPLDDDYNYYHVGVRYNLHSEL